MSAGKSPNNAFILHKQRMVDVFSDIRLDQKPNLSYNFAVSNIIECNVSYLYFYWAYCPSKGRIFLYSKGYVNRNGKKVSQKICAVLSRLGSTSPDSI